VRKPRTAARAHARRLIWKPHSRQAETEIGRGIRRLGGRGDSTLCAPSPLDDLLCDPKPLRFAQVCKLNKSASHPSRSRCLRRIGTSRKLKRRRTLASQPRRSRRPRRLLLGRLSRSGLFSKAHLQLSAEPRERPPHQAHVNNSNDHRRDLDELVTACAPIAKRRSSKSRPVPERHVDGRCTRRRR